VRHARESALLPRVLASKVINMQVLELMLKIPTYTSGRPGEMNMKRCIPILLTSIAMAGGAVAVAGCSSGNASSATAAAPSTTGSGPFQITLDSCAMQALPLSSESTLTGTVTITNIGNDLTAMVQVNMNFTDGSTVVGTGFTNESASLSPGQSEQLNAPAQDASGNPLASATGCQPTIYLVTDSPGQPGTTYSWH